MDLELPPAWMLWVKFSLEQHGDLILSIGARLYAGIVCMVKALLILSALTIASREGRLWMLAIRKGE